MAPSYPSIQSFYQREPSKSTQLTQSPVSGDGFTTADLTSHLEPSSRKWNPKREYDVLPIGDLVPGPRAVTFNGRIVNFRTIHGKTQKQPKASGWQYLIVKDSGGAISVKLYFAQKPYSFKLGQLVSIWTAFVSDSTKSGGGPIPGVLVCANIFPGRVTSDHIIIHTGSIGEETCRTPLLYSKETFLQGLMTLDSFIKSGFDDIPDVKLLVCVKSIGPRKKITKKDGGEVDLAEILLFDHTEEVRLKLWGEMIESAKEWQAGKTILLLSNPSYTIGFAKKGDLGIKQSTMVEVEPDFPDAVWLRKYAARLRKKESLAVKFPQEFWDGVVKKQGIDMVLFNLADIAEEVRRNPTRTFTGFISVIINDMSLVVNQRCSRLMCITCCSLPIYSNTPQIPCPHCSTPLTLSPNPRTIGLLLDETGCIPAGKLLWSSKAWEQLFGLSHSGFCEMDAELARGLEERMCFERVHLGFGWMGEGERGDYEDEELGRLVVLEVRRS
ncbi:Acting on ester bonds protein, partial [Scytalidium lignicola]